MEAAGDFVAVVVELSAGVQHRHDDFGGGHPFLVHFGGNAPAVVRHGDRFPDMDYDLDFRAVASERLVDGIVHEFENHVVQAGAVIGVADVHAGPLPNRVKAFEDLDAFGVVFVGAAILHCFLHHRKRLPPPRKIKL